MVKSVKLKKIKLSHEERLEEKKQSRNQVNKAPHAEISNMEYKTAAPPVCTIFGQKSEHLLQNLVKRFTKKIINQFTAPVTCCVSKINRLSFYRIKEDMNDVIDSSKIGDIVILTVEEELNTAIFEFISLLKSNGFPKTCVYIHTEKNTKESKKEIKKMKERLQEELFVGVKFFSNKDYNYLSKITRYLSELKIRPIEFKCNNPFLVVDNYKINEDQISLMGYLRGSSIQDSGNLHIPGIGDVNYEVEEIISDPCPLPTGRLLDIKKKMIYAPLDFKETNIEMKINNECPLFGPVKEVNIFGDEETGVEYDVSSLHETGCESQKSDSETENTIYTGKSDVNIKTHVSDSDADTETRGLDDSVNTHLENDEVEIKEETDKIIPGKYLKIKINPKSLENTCLKENKGKLINLLTSSYLIKSIESTILILGFLKETTEKQSIAIMKCKRSRFFKKLLKSNDPVIISVGWRRLQIIPIYFMQDSISDPRRYIKVTPLNLHFFAAFYTPHIPLNSNCSIIRLDSTFKIAGSGKIEEIKEMEFSIPKKLKLVGYPSEIHKNTAIIKDMFNTDLEVTKFMGSKIQTVSKIRGIIKKAINKEGNFRAKFEGQIKLSDIIFLNCSVPVFPIKGFLNWNSSESITKYFHDLEFMHLRLRKDIYAEESNEKEEKEYRNKRFEDYRMIEEKPIEDHRKLKIEKKLSKNLPFDLKLQLNEMRKNKSLETVHIKHFDLEKYSKLVKNGVLIKSHKEILSPEENTEKILNEKKRKKEINENLRKKQEEELKKFIEERLRIKREGIIKQKRSKKKYIE